MGSCKSKKGRMYGRRDSPKRTCLNCIRRTKNRDNGYKLTCPYGNKRHTVCMSWKFEGRNN